MAIHISVSFWKSSVCRPHGQTWQLAGCSSYSGESRSSLLGMAGCGSWPGVAAVLVSVAMPSQQLAWHGRTWQLVGCNSYSDERRYAVAAVGLKSLAGRY